jgi:Tol biopolymer transport system component
MEWTPDGSGLLFIGTRKGESLSTRRDQLYLLSIANGKARRLTSEGSRLQVSSLGVSADGSVLVVPFNRSSQLWAMDAGGDAASAKQITNGLNDGRAGIAPLPDGRIGFVARSGENLNVWLVNQDGSDQRQITSSPSNVEELRTSPDGKSFFFSSLTDGKPVLYACDQEGGNIRRVPIEDGFNVDSAISPDGNWIAFSSAASENGALKETIRAAVATGGESFPIAGPMAVNPRFSPDGRFLSYIGAGGSLHVSTFPSGSIAAEFKSTPGAVLNTGAKWSPDGGSLAYIVRTAGVGNIWLQPLDGSASHPLTNFSSGEILNFEFSANGKHLILARGYPIRDAVLLKASPAVSNG